MQDFTTFYETTRNDVFRTVVAATGDRSRAEDAVAEAFTKAYERWPAIATHPNPVAWLVRTALNHQRSLWRRRRREVHGHADRVTQDRQATDPALIAAVAKLPRRQREVVACRLVLDLDTAVTGELLGMAPGTVTAHLHRAMTTLRASLAPELGATTERTH